MSPINSALQYKIQKMERTLSTLMEENRALRTMINEYNSQTTNPTQVYNYAASQGGNPGQAMGAYLAGVQQPSVGGMGKVGGGMSPTSTTSGGGIMSGGVGSFGGNVPAAARSVQAPAAGGFNAADFGSFLAGLEGNPNAASMVAQYLGLPFAGGTESTTTGRATQTTQRRR